MENLSLTCPIYMLAPTFDIFISDEEVQSLVHKDFIGPDIEIQNFLGLIMYKIEERERLEKEEK
jgi:hypothetical protein